jgi:hypothetical protein|tara:strand:- start:688 stop:1497 length:810 start_codon:yes stop_codon:yes gene_type:complete
MPERNSPACPLHGDLPRARHPHNFFGIVTVIDQIIDTISGVGTTSYTKCPYGYAPNFEGVVRALEDLNATTSGISGGGSSPVITSGVATGSGLYASVSGDLILFNLDSRAEGSVSLNYDSNTAVYSGSASSTGGGASVTVSGAPGTGYSAGDLWFDTNEGRLFVYASGNDVQSPDWYQTNAEGIALMSDLPPSGTGENAPARHGSIWFNQLAGSLFVYDAQTSGWYETGPQRSVAYGSAPPSPPVAGAGWYDTIDSALKVWNGTSWIST